MVELDTARGTRDIFPEDEMLREEIIYTLQSIFKLYGFVPLDTPIIERWDVLGAKFAAGDESDAMSEVYRLKDNGERELGLRFDLTVPLSRFVGMNRTLKMPFKRYQIGKVYRDAPIKAGRYREFTQCDVDIVGSTDMIADATCVMIAIDAYKKLGVDVTIKVNNRKILTGLMVANGIAEEKTESIMMTIDKLDKIGRDGVLSEASEKGFDSDTVGKLIDIINLQGTTTEKIDLFKKMLPENPGLAELEELFSILGDVPNVEYSPSLARGLGYYTGTVFEVYARENEKIGAIGAGGRYDKLIEGYLEAAQINTGGKVFPAVGISFGLDRIVDVLKRLGKASEKKTNTVVYIIPLGTKNKCFNIASQLRANRINTDIDFKGKGLSKIITSCSDRGIPYVLIVGEDEVALEKYTLRDLRSGEEQKLTVDEVISILKTA